MSFRIRCVPLTVLLSTAPAVLLAGCGSSSSSQGSASSVQTVHIITANPHTETLDLPPKGKSPGDVYVFDATILSPDGHAVLGLLRGTQTEVKREHGTETVQGVLTYELGGGNSIVIGGLSQYPATGTGLVKGKSYVRPVLGGTGKYAGATGTVTSQQLSGGRYDQVFRMVTQPGTA